MPDEPAISMSAPDVDESDVAAVVEVLRSGRLALGPWAERFEEELAAYAGVPHAVAVSSGTAALHLALVALGIGPGAEVLVPSFTFSASVSVIFQVGARPVFVDVLPDVYTLDPADLEAKVTPRTRGIMVVDVFGHPAEWREVLKVAEGAGLKVVDDACEALGAEYRGRRLGSLGDASAFAFYPNKQITAGEGGMLLTADGEVAEAVRSLRNQGRAAMGSWLEHARLGYNYRLDEMSAALGVSQLRRLDDLLARRERVARTYGRLLAELPGVEAPRVRSGVRMSWFVYVVRLAPRLERGPIMEAMGRRGVPTRAYFSPIHLQPYVRRRLGDLDGSLPVTEEAARRTIALPFHGRLGEDEIRRVVDTLGEALAEAGAGS